MSEPSAERAAERHRLESGEPEIRGGAFPSIGFTTGLEPHPEGEWVMFADHAAALASAECERDEARAEAGRVQAALDETTRAIMRLPEPPRRLGDGPDERVTYALGLMEEAGEAMAAFGPGPGHPHWELLARIREALGKREDENDA